MNFSRSRYFIRGFEADFDLFTKRLFTPTMILFAFTAINLALEKLQSKKLDRERAKEVFFELKSLWVQRQSLTPISPQVGHITECDNVADYIYAMVRERTALHWQIYAYQHRANAKTTSSSEKSAEAEEKELTQEEFDASEMETFLQDSCMATADESERVRACSLGNKDIDLEAIKDYLMDQFGEEQSLDTLRTTYFGKAD